MDTPVIERRHVRLHKVGGSRSVVVPKEWLDRQGIEDEVDLVLTPDGIVIKGSGTPTPSIEDEPAFETFLNFVLNDALSHPEKLIDPGERLARAKDLLEGVEPD